MIGLEIALKKALKTINIKLVSVLAYDKENRSFAKHLIVSCNAGAFSDAAVVHDCKLDFGRNDLAVAYTDHIAYAAYEVEVSVFIKIHYIVNNHCIALKDLPCQGFLSVIAEHVHVA